MHIIKKRTCRWKNYQNQLLLKLVEEYRDNTKDGQQKINWRMISFLMFQKGYMKSSHQCRQRWNNHLDPKLCKSQWTLQQDLQLLMMYRQMGQRWSKIAKLNGRRNEHMIKNRYYSLKNKWIKNNCEINFKINRLIRDIQNRLMEKQIKSQVSLLSQVQKELVQVGKEEILNEVQVKKEGQKIQVNDMKSSQSNWLYFDDLQMLQKQKYKIQQIQSKIPILPFEILGMIYKGEKFERQEGTNSSIDDEWLQNMIAQKNNKWFQQDDY